MKNWKDKETKPSERQIVEQGHGTKIRFGLMNFGNKYDWSLFCFSGAAG